MPFNFETTLLDTRVTFVFLRFSRLSEPAALRRDKLQDSLVLQQYLADVEEELAWIREEEPLVKSDDLGRNLVGKELGNEVHFK